TYKFGATGDGGIYAGRSTWICTENWNNQNYPVDRDLYADLPTSGFADDVVPQSVPMFVVVGFNGTDKIVYWNSTSYLDTALVNGESFRSSINKAIDEFPVEGVYLKNPIPSKAYTIGGSEDIDISDVFGEYDLNPVTVTLENNSDPTAVSASVDGTTLSLEGVGHSDTFTTITLKGESSVNSLTTSFDVYTHIPTEFEELVQEFEVDYFPPPFWELKYNTAADTTVAGLPNGANLIDPPTTDTWFRNTPATAGFGSDYIQSGNSSATIMYWAPEFNWLITPPMQLDYDDYVLDFHIWFDNEYASKFHVMVDDGITGWTSILALSSADSNNHLDSLTSLDLSSFVSQTIRVAFVYEYTDGMEVAIDSVSVWSRTVGIDDIPIPTMTKLEQNYPNPFNPTTEINFSLDKDAFAKLTVFNSNGEIIQKLNNKRLKKGIHRFNFNAKNLNSGIYFYQLEVDGIRSSKKMILIK
ncbi:MAG: T9SS type A sorting domain-containing protein, partial [Candidatus Delongbacteria bacterium]|nr:T9SS type A sorting domain-containing protein [Candidatus Delongbacteria bacterium]